jgi:hypothetical protein
MAFCQTLPCPIATVGGGTSLGDVKPLGLDIWWSIYRMGTCTTEPYVEYIIFYQGMLILYHSHHGF